MTSRVKTVTVWQIEKQYHSDYTLSEGHSWNEYCTSYVYSHISDRRDDIGAIHQNTRKSHFNDIILYVETLDVQTVSLRHRRVDCGVVWRRIYNPSLNVVDCTTWRQNINRMRTGTSQWANIGLTDSWTVTHSEDGSLFQCSVTWHFSWYTAHSVSRVDEGLRRQDASSRLLKSRLNRQRVSSPTITHTDNTVYIKIKKTS